MAGSVNKRHWYTLHTLHPQKAVSLLLQEKERKLNKAILPVESMHIDRIMQMREDSLPLLAHSKWIGYFTNTLLRAHITESVAATGEKHRNNSQ